MLIFKIFYTIYYFISSNQYLLFSLLEGPNIASKRNTFNEIQISIKYCLYAKKYLFNRDIYAKFKIFAKEVKIEKIFLIKWRKRNFFY